MSDFYVRNVIEAALLAAGRPLAADELTALFEEREAPTGEQLTAVFETLREDYRERGIELVEVASGFRIQIRPQLAQPVSRLWQERPAKYSRALLETLALIAYRQPITRGEIEQIRGVTVNPNIIKTLLERGWVRVVGHRDVPGRPELLGTTREFLDYFGLKRLEELPTLGQLKELEEMRVQLTLPGAEPMVPAEPEAGEAAVAGAPAPEGQGVDPTRLDADAEADADAEEAPAVPREPREDAAEGTPGEPRQGLVARGAEPE